MLATPSSDATELRSVEDVRRDLDRHGISVSQWARDNGFKPKQVLKVLNGGNIGRFGAAHNIAVALRLKAGVTDDAHGATKDHGAAPEQQVSI